MHHMVTTLRSGPFTESLCKKSAANLNKLLQRTTKFMHLEEFKKYRNKVWAKLMPEKEEVDKSSKYYGNKKAREPKFLRFTKYL